MLFVIVLSYGFGAKGNIADTNPVGRYGRERTATRDPEEPRPVLEWTLIVSLGTIYFALLFTVATVTFARDT